MINVIGIGQNRENMTLGALKAIEESDVIIGYKKYIDQIEDLIFGCTRHNRVLKTARKAAVAQPTGQRKTTNGAA